MASNKPLYSKTMSATAHQLPGGFLRIGPLMNLPQLLRDMNCDPAPVFASLGFDCRQFADPNFEAPYALASRLLARCAAVTGCNHLGLLLGERASISSLGLTGFLLQCAPTVDLALQDLLHHLDLNDRGGITILVVDSKLVQLGYDIILPEATAKAQIYDLAMTYLCRVMRGLCGQQWAPTQVLMSRQPVPNPAPYHHALGSGVRFNESRNALIFEANWLQRPTPGADPLLHRYLEQKAEDIHVRKLTNIVDHLQVLLRRSLASHHCSVTDISRQLGMHERTLNRHLTTAGTSFRLELERIRYEWARQMLAKSTMQAAQIADALDYTNTTSFSRAFKRWSAVTPSTWRNSYRLSHNNADSPDPTFGAPEGKLNST